MLQKKKTWKYIIHLSINSPVGEMSRVQKIPRLIRRRILAIFALIRAQFLFFFFNRSANARTFAIFSQWEVRSLRRGAVDFEEGTGATGVENFAKCMIICEQWGRIIVVSSSLFIYLLLRWLISLAPFLYRPPSHYMCSTSFKSIFLVAITNFYVT